MPAIATFGAVVQMHVKEEIIDRITFMNDYLEPYEDMAMILIHLLLLTVSHMNHVH